MIDIAVILLRKSEAGALSGAPAGLSVKYYTQMGLGMTEHEAAGLGGHKGVAVALARGLKVEMLNLEGDMRVFCEILRVDYHAVISMAALVEYLAVDHIERAEL